MHQNLAITLWQFNYSKNSFIVLITEVAKDVYVQRHGQLTPVLSSPEMETL